MSFSSILFLCVVLVGVWVSLVSVGLLGFWVGMELSFLGLIPLIVGVSVEESDSSMKYFIVQVIGSMAFIMGLVMMYGGVFIYLEQFFVIMGMVVKLGVFPFYFWVPVVMSKLSWVSCFYISVIQKVSPVWLFSNMGLSGAELGMVEVLGVLTALAGCLGGLGILQYRVLLGYSSLVHMGWMLFAGLIKFEFFLFYLLIYSFILGGFMSSLWVYGVYSFTDLLKESNFYGSYLTLWVSLYVLSLAGVPPLSGCFLKVLFFYQCWLFFPLSSCVLVISVMVSLYFYLCVFFEFLLGTGSYTGFFQLNFFSGPGMVGNLSIILNILLGYPLFMSMGSVLI